MVDYVKQQLIAMFGKDTVFKGGLRVQTTIDPAYQKLAAEAISSVLDRPGDPSAALVSVEPNTGYIRAMVSSSDYDKSKFNLAAQAQRQPGSTFKVFALVGAIEMGIDPNSTYYQSMPLQAPDPGELAALVGLHLRRPATTARPACTRRRFAATTRSTPSWPWTSGRTASWTWPSGWASPRS